jgi:DNA-binding transcriptional LysR family regulator
MRINFDFTDLEAFLALRETGSFHLAAERLGLSQSSVTRRIQKLEASLGAQLFERTTREVRPTLAAKRFQMRAEAILGDTREAARAMRDESMAHAHQRAQTVSVATIPTVVAGLIVPAIAAFRREGHTARIRLLDRAANEVAEAVAGGEADLGICSVPMLEPATEFDLLFSDPIVLALPPGHVLAAGQVALCWADLAGEALILPARGTGNRLLIDEAMARTGLPMQWVFEVGRTATALDLVAGGIGIAPVPRSAIPAGERRVITRPVLDPAVLRPIGLIRRIGQKDRPAVQALVAAIRVAAEQIQGEPA